MYVRVSTEEQAAEGVSLDQQEARCRAYAELYGLNVVAVVTGGGESAKPVRRGRAKRGDWRAAVASKRPGLGRVLDLLDTGEADGVVIAKLDRLTRSLADLDELLSRYFNEGASLHCIAERVDTSSAAGRLCLNMLMSVAQWEREVISERTKAALQHKRSCGERTGSVPFGYTLAEDGVMLVEDSMEQRVITEARRLRAAGLSLRKVAAELASHGFVPRKGGQWYAAQVQRMVAA